MGKGFLRVAAAAALAAIVTAGCAAQRWSIERAETSFKAGDKESHAANTLLLDRRTGDTWLLWPEGDQYHWQKLKR
jgi:hypothetical protein